MYICINIYFSHTGTEQGAKSGVVCRIPPRRYHYGVASMSWLLKIIGLFCKTAL